MRVKGQDAGQMEALTGKAAKEPNTKENMVKDLTDMRFQKRPK